MTAYNKTARPLFSISLTEPLTTNPWYIWCVLALQMYNAFLMEKVPWEMVPLDWQLTSCFPAPSGIAIGDLHSPLHPALYANLRPRVLALI